MAHITLIKKIRIVVKISFFQLRLFTKVKTCLTYLILTVIYGFITMIIVILSLFCLFLRILMGCHYLICLRLFIFVLSQMILEVPRSRPRNKAWVLVSSPTLWRSSPTQIKPDWTIVTFESWLKTYFSSLLFSLFWVLISWFTVLCCVLFSLSHCALMCIPVCFFGFLIDLKKNVCVDL